MKSIAIVAVVLLAACAAPVPGSWDDVITWDAERLKSANIGLLCDIYAAFNNPDLKAQSIRFKTEISRRKVIHPQYWPAVERGVVELGMNETELRCAVPAEIVGMTARSGITVLQWRSHGVYYFTENGIVTDIAF